MEKVQDLYNQLQANCLEIEKILKSIDEVEQDIEKIDEFEYYFENEFLLYMKHIGIYEDLLLALEETPKTLENEFELAKIKRDIDKLLRVEVIEL